MSLWDIVVAKKRANGSPEPSRPVEQVRGANPGVSARAPTADRAEIEAAVVKHFCDGVAVSQIAQLIRERFGIAMTREAPWRVLGEAARDGRFRYLPRSESSLADRIKERFSPIREAELEVVNTSVVEDVARVGAERLLKLVCQHNRMNLKVGAAPEVHVGFAGGRCLRLVAEEFARLLTRKHESLPETIYVHAMIAGFNSMDPTLNPLFFFSSFVDGHLQVETKFMGMFAPGIVSDEKYNVYRQERDISAAFEESKKLNIIVTSASEWEDEHSAFKGLCDAEMRALLDSSGCIGDIMWHPLFPAGKSAQLAYRLLTLKDLEELPGFIHAGGDVLLVLGPCSKCFRPKSKVLERLLEQKRRVVTHFVVDSRSAKGLFRAPGDPWGTHHSER